MCASDKGLTADLIMHHYSCTGIKIIIDLFVNEDTQALHVFLLDY